jgi:hypothetical protein
VVHIKPLPQYSPGSAKVTVNVLMADTVTGGFYAGTNNGVYHYYADSLRHLSYPTVSLKSLMSQRQKRTAPGIGVRLIPSTKDLHPEAATLDGRRIGPRAAGGASQAAGVYVQPAQAEASFE